MGRKTKTTILIVGEGKEDAIFLQRLKTVYYSSRDPEVNLKIEKSFGGSPQDVIIHAIKLSNLCSYDYVYVLVDWDRKNDIKNKPQNINLLFSKPCLEKLLLDILDIKCKIDRVSDRYKSIFKKECNKDGITKDYLTKKLSRDLLDSKRNSNKTLDEILNAMLK